MEVNLNDQFLGDVLMSPEIRHACESTAGLAAMLYQAQVAKRTGLTAASAHAHTEIGGQGTRENDRWIGVLTVGGVGPMGTPEDVAAHEFGAGDHPGSTGLHANAAAHDMDNVLLMLGLV